MTDKTKHTPGPWNNAALGPVVFDGSGTSIAMKHPQEDDYDKWLNNARLIAAAPELFEFAIQVLYSLGGGCRPDHDAAPYTREELIEMASDLVQRVDS